MFQQVKDQLRSIFQNRFNQEAWKSIVVNIFGAGQVRPVYEKFTSDEDLEEGYFLGSIDTPDNYRIGLFYYNINSGSVAHKKVGFRNLVKRFINQNWGEFDAAIVVFNDGEEWRLSFICDIKEEATAPKRFTYVFGEDNNFYKTPVDRFEKLQTEEPTFANIRKTFSVDALSDDFFDDYRELYADFVQYITGKRYVKSGSKWEEKVITRPNHQFQTTFERNDKLVRDYIKKMFGRIVFLYFLQRKGWLNGNKQYMHDLFYNSDKKDDFLDGVLEPLFFEVLNEEKPNRTKEAKSLPGCDNIPYLNGGLFAKDEIDERTCVFPAEYFKRLFDFLDSYNFTIDENDTDDAEIGIDPEMLGRIFENLLEDNKDKGAFYTPKEIVDYMCRESLIAYLVGDLPEIKEEKLRLLVEKLDTTDLSDKDKLDIRKTLQKVKICDPAIGSGAFPMGLVNLLSKIYVAMKTDTDTAKMKRHIMEQNIYGVDIEQGAVDIARLRFWLAMIVEEKEPIPLPNLHFKIMQGNSLLESYSGIDLSDLTKVNAQKGLWDSENFERENLIEALRKYYKTADHSERDRLFNEIINNVRRQLLAKGITLPNGEDPSANTDFFLWHTWFSDVFANGGFDIVIGNPPYGAKVPNEQKKTFQMLYPVAKTISGKQKGSQDTFVVFLNQAYNLLRTTGICSMIVPMSITGAKSMEGLHNLLKRGADDIYVSSYGDRPRRVFEGAEQQVSIIQFIKTNTTAQNLYSTTINKRFSDEPFSVMIDNLEFVNVLEFVSNGRIPKVSKDIEINILRKLHSTPQCLKDYYDVNGYPIYYRKAGGRYYKIIKTDPTNSSAEGSIKVLKKYHKVVAACMASNIFYWFWLIHSDWHNLRTNELEWFPIPSNISDVDIVNLNKLYESYENDLNDKSELTSTGLLRFFCSQIKTFYR
ncbi:MAG: Eco57I restriction-modification methylase domain-containing protein [Paramuribaculum sp.]|nr:Eco57I restriction-modification methylase domain-containing protein [Paramuribaculum sp.]